MHSMLRPYSLLVLALTLVLALVLMLALELALILALNLALVFVSLVQVVFVNSLVTGLAQVPVRTGRVGVD